VAAGAAACSGSGARPVQAALKNNKANIKIELSHFIIFFPSKMVIKKATPPEELPEAQ
jgi:hypothetical protein